MAGDIDPDAWGCAIVILAIASALGDQMMEFNPADPEQREAARFHGPSFALLLDYVKILEHECSEWQQVTAAATAENARLRALVERLGWDPVREIPLREPSG